MKKLKDWKVYVMLRHLRLYITGCVYKWKLRKKKYNINVMSIEDTIAYIKRTNCSVVRYGDGEIVLMSGSDLTAGYQSYDAKLAQGMLDIWDENKPELLLCLSDIFDGLSDYRGLTRAFYYMHLYKYGDLYEKHCDKERVYGSTFLTRPYYIFKDKTKSLRRFELLKELWQDRDVVLVEGALSRQGIGNDLFENAKSVRRILCPPANAYSRLAEIEAAICETIEPNSLLLVALGPTAKVLIRDMAEKGYTLIDIGHLDSEYEWCKMGAKKKVAIKNKHTAECDDDTVSAGFYDETYESQIVARIGC